MQGPHIKISNAFQVGLLGGLGVLTALILGGAIATLANLLTYIAAAIFIALGLDPIVSFLEKRNVKRALAILIVVIGLVSVISGLALAVFPPLVTESARFIELAPAILTDLSHLPLVISIDSQFNGAVTRAIEGVAAFLSDSANWPSLLGGVVQVGLSIFNGAFGGMVIVILTLYFLASMERFKRWVYSLVPASRREKFADIAEQIATSIGRYVMGQVSIALINATLGFIFMSIVGIKFALVLAFITFLLALIPLVGALAGASIVVIVALGTSPTTALIAAIYYLIYLQVESYLISPRIMNRAVAIPGAVVVVAALAGGALLGILGALVAIPVAASIILITRQVFVPRQEAR